VEQWDEERLRAEANGSHLQSLSGIRETYRGLVERLAQTRREFQEIEKCDAAARAQMAGATQVRDAAAALVEAKRRVLELAQRVQSLEEHRHLLEPGVACPLCGSLEHPAATRHGNPSEEVARARRELKESEGAWKKAERALQEVIQAQAAHQATLERIGREVTQILGELDKCAEQWRIAAGAAGFEGPLGDDALLENALLLAQEHRETVQRQLRLIRQLSDAAQKAGAAAHTARVTWMAACGDKEKAEGELKNCREAWKQAQQRAQTARDAAGQIMGALGVTLTSYGETPPSLESDPPLLQRRMQNRIKAFDEKTREKAAAEQALAGLQQKQEGLLQQRLTAADDLKVAQGREQETTQQQTILRVRRTERFGDKNVTQERARLQRVLLAIRQEHDGAQKICIAAMRRRDAARQSQEVLSGQTQEHLASIQRSESALQASAQQSGFASLDALRQSLLPTTEAERRAALRTDLKRQEQTHLAQRETFEKLRAALPAEAAGNVSQIAELETQKQAAEASMHGLGEQRGALNEELRQDSDRRQGVLSLTQEIANATAEKLRWKALSDLIGSATGQSFSRFAQGLTLERLVVLANQHLHHLNPRYSLRRARADVEDLELEVVDHYQADATRPMASLSGGESFLASLALALGLSDLASGRKAIESLFIDEGFGTLDAETLDSAMAALERLQATGKTIGLISHVESMKERIATQIQITKGVGGWSEVKVV